MKFDWNAVPSVYLPVVYCCFCAKMAGGIVVTEMVWSIKPKMFVYHLIFHRKSLAGFCFILINCTQYFLSSHNVEIFMPFSFLVLLYLFVPIAWIIKISLDLLV